jgi:cysteinyl-tRNA synthetase
VSDPPDEVLRLTRLRAERRAARDFAAADELRERIARLGYRVVDRPDGGWTLEGAPMPPESGSRTGAPRMRPDAVPSILDRPAVADVTVQWLAEGWDRDVARGITSFRRHEGGRTVQHVVVETVDVGASWPDDVDVIPLLAGTGWATARNCGLRSSLGRVVVLVDGSVEATGDVYLPLERALEDPRVGIAGPFGLVTDDLRDFRESEGIGEDRQVDAIEGYLMAFRREMLTEAGMLDERFRFYRTADIEYSFRVKDGGRRAVVVDVPVERHEHRVWSHTPEDERERLSKRNFYRFLDRFRGRFDLTVGSTS